MTQQDTTQFNSQLLLDLVKWAEADEEALANDKFTGWGRWDQGMWAAADSLSDKEILNGMCQTAYCMAGQAAAQSGYRMWFPRNQVPSGETLPGNVRGWHTDHCIKIQPTDALDNWGKPIWEDVPGAMPLRISDVARESLGLDPLESSHLFNADNEIYTIKMIVNTIFVRRDLSLPYPDVECFDIVDGGW